MSGALVQRFGKFVAVGFTSAAIDFTIFNLLWRNEQGLHFQVALVISFLCAASNGYIWNRRWTFKDSPQKEVHRQYTQFLMVGAVGLLLNQVLTTMFRSLLLHTFSFPTWWAMNLGKAGAIALVAIWNFTANQLWTFGQRK